MHFSIGLICRGQGVTYISVSAERVEECELRFRAESEEGVLLPVEAYHIEGDKSILVTPLLETDSVVLIVKRLTRRDRCLRRRQRGLSAHR